MGWSNAATGIVVVLMSGCSGSPSDPGSEDTPSLPPPVGPPCVPDDEAGTTWDEAAGHFVPLERIVTYVNSEFEGQPTRYFVPEFEPQGIAMAFHGAGGDVGLSLEWDALFNELIQAGWAVVLTESEDTSWAFDQGASNPDTARILRWLDELVATTTIRPDVPILPIGFSAGGNMVPRFMGGAIEAGWTIPMGISHNSGASGDRLGLPFLWVSSENDFDKNGNNTEDARRNYESYIAEGSPGLLLETPEIPWIPMRMVRHGSYHPEESQAVFDELVAMGIITAGGERVPEIEGHDKVLETYAAESLVGGADRVAEQLRVVWATHRVNGIHAIEECEFVMANWPE